MAPTSFRMGLLAGGFLTALAILAAAAGPLDQRPVRSSPARGPLGIDDLAMVQTVLSQARGASLLMCELASGALRGNSWWRNREPVEDEVREVLHWVRRDPADPAVVPVLVGAMADGDPCVARTAARLLGRMESGEASDRLIAALDDTGAQVRGMAAMGLGIAESPAAFTPLIEALSGDPDPRVRLMAAWALGELEDPGAIGPLSDALSGGDVPLRRAAASALGQIEHPDGLPVLIGALADSDAIVRSQAARALGRIEDHGAVDALSRTLASDPSADVRVAAARALGEIEE